MQEWEFKTDAEVMRFIQSQADDIERATVYVCKPFDKHPNVGLTLHLLGGDRLQMSKERSVQILNDGILARLNIDVSYQ